MEQTFWVALTVAFVGSSVLHLLVSKSFQRFSPRRNSERLDAWQNELETLEKIDTSTSRGMTLHQLGRAIVHTGLANRLVPNPLIQNTAFFILSMVALLLGLALLTTPLITGPGSSWVRGIIGTIYVIFGLLATLVSIWRFYYTPLFRKLIVAGLELSEQQDQFARAQYQSTASTLFRVADPKTRHRKAREAVLKGEKHAKRARSRAAFNGPYKKHVALSFDPDLRISVLRFIRQLETVSRQNLGILSAKPTTYLNGKSSSGND